MISIISIGSVKPGHNIKESSYSALNPEYIKSTLNKDVSLAVKNTTTGTTQLAADAALLAIKKAGITKEQIGLLIADSSTPLETIPGESQRVACLLGLKIPAYDILSGSSALFNFLQSINSWKPDKQPEYILCISVNALTQRIDYSGGEEQKFFTDAAGAMIISAKHSGKLKLTKLTDYRQPELRGPMEINLFGHIRVDQDLANKNHAASCEKLKQYLSTEKGKYRIFSDMYPYQQKEEGVIYPSQANSLGSGLMCVLAENWDSLTLNEEILLNVTSLETMGSAIIKMEVSH